MNYQFTSRQLTLDNLSRSNQGHMTFKGLRLLNGASLTLGGIERLNQDHWVIIWLCIMDN